MICFAAAIVRFVGFASCVDRSSSAGCNGKSPCFEYHRYFLRIRWIKLISSAVAAVNLHVLESFVIFRIEWGRTLMACRTM